MFQRVGGYEGLVSLFTVAGCSMEGSVKISKLRIFCGVPLGELKAILYLAPSRVQDLEFQWNAIGAPLVWRMF